MHKSYQDVIDSAVVYGVPLDLTYEDYISNYLPSYPSSSSIGSRLYLGALINFNDVNRGVKTSGQWSTDAAR